jgi:HEAT repeat protein
VKPCQPASQQTLRDVAILILCDLGSETVIEAMLDTLSNQTVNVIEFRLTKMGHGLVRDALQRRLNSAKDNTLIPLLTLLGTFGDPTVLPDLKAYTDDPRQEVADAAYLAEQRILGLAYF